MFSRAGANPSLNVGFRKEGRQLHGHAWVCVDGAPLLDAGDVSDCYSQLFCFGPDGSMSISNGAVGTVEAADKRNVLPTVASA